MACFNPILAVLGPLNANGKHKVTFKGAKDQRSEECTKLPCGKCIGCLRNRAREWGIRCVHESKFYSQNAFITLTYSPQNLPANGSLDVGHFQRFLKRLRKIAPQKLRYFHCGEYGPKLLRPHYHALIFGYDFPDKKLFRTNGLGQKVYTSKQLEKLWPYGFSTIGAVTEESAQYVARYTLKKVFGKKQKEHYGEKKPEYVTMSRRPGIGRNWYEKYQKDVYPKGILVFNGRKQMPPRYYDSIYKETNPDEYEEIKNRRKSAANSVRAFDTINGKIKLVDNNDSFRLAVRENIVQRRIKLLNRFMEEQNDYEGFLTI